MAQNKQKPVSVTYLYQQAAASSLLEGITLAAVEAVGFDATDNLFSSVIDKPEDIPVFTVSDKMECNFCSAKFENRTEQKEHYKSDWHRFNLKQKLKGIESVSEERFEEIAGGDLSSISGSDSESDDDSHPADAEDEDIRHVEGIGHRHPKVFFRNNNGELLSIYRCVLHSKKNRAGTHQELLNTASDMPKRMKWAILLTSGGHFAGAVLDGENVLVHKTFHRYVVRAKRGTVQSSRDKQGNAPSSAGAHLRRYNEAALTQEIQELIESWSAELKACDCIFLRSPSYNKALYFSGKNSILNKADPRIRQIPFVTRRPTFKELKRVHDLLSAVENYGEEGILSDHIKVSPKKTIPVKPKASETKKKIKERKGKAHQEDVEKTCDSTDEEDNEIFLQMSELSINFSDLKEFEGTKKPRRKKANKDKSNRESQESENLGAAQTIFDEAQFKLRNSLYTACKTQAVEILQEHLQPLINKSGNQLAGSINVSSSTETEPSHLKVLNEPFGEKKSTLLHMVAAQGFHEAIEALMLAGADPTLKDLKGAVPYAVSKDKETRQAFRRFMGLHPEKYDYNIAQIPSPLTAEMENAKKAKDAERRKAQKKARKEKMKDQKEEERKIKEEEKEKQRFLSLSDREKRALAAERRLASQVTAEQGAAPCLSRCFQCASDITGKIPFEYMEYRFCSPKCLKEHRFSQKQNKS